MNEVNTALEELLGNFTAQFTVGNIVTLLGIGIGSAIVLFLGWFGIRKLVSMLQTAFRKGQVKV